MIAKRFLGLIKDHLSVVLEVLMLLVSMGMCLVMVFAFLLPQRTTEDEISRQNTPHLEGTYYPARSIDLMADYDARSLSRLERTPKLVKTRFWRTQVDLAKSQPNATYVFLLITNQGPGRAEDLQISVQDVATKPNGESSDGLTELEAPLGILESHELLALLVDVLQLPKANLLLVSKPMLRYERLTFSVQYGDALGRKYSKNLDFFKDVGPAVVAPPN